MLKAYRSVSIRNPRRVSWVHVSCRPYWSRRGMRTCGSVCASMTASSEMMLSTTRRYVPVRSQGEQLIGGIHASRADFNCRTGCEIRAVALENLVDPTAAA